MASPMCTQRKSESTQRKSESNDAHGFRRLALCITNALPTRRVRQNKALPWKADAQLENRVILSLGCICSLSILLVLGLLAGLIGGSQAMRTLQCIIICLLLLLDRENFQEWIVETYALVEHA